MFDLSLKRTFPQHSYPPDELSLPALKNRIAKREPMAIGSGNNREASIFRMVRVAQSVWAIFPLTPNRPIPRALGQTEVPRYGLRDAVCGLPVAVRVLGGPHLGQFGFVAE